MKNKFSLQPWFLTKIVLVLMAMVPIILPAQLRIIHGAGKPTEAIQADWYVDTVAHNAWSRANADWLQYMTPVKKMLHCGNMIVVVSDIVTILMTNNMERLSCNLACDCFEGLACMHGAQYRWYYFEGKPLSMAWEPQAYTQWEDELSQDTLNGRLGFCSTVAVLFMLHADTHGWGILGTDGRWLIEPIFDAPFHFQNGIAEVLYYGQKRKINEKGEFVE